MWARCSPPWNRRLVLGGYVHDETPGPGDVDRHPLLDGDGGARRAHPRPSGTKDTGSTLMGQPNAPRARVSSWPPRPVGATIASFPHSSAGAGSPLQPVDEVDDV